MNVLFPKQNLIPALGYIRNSKWMCGTIDFFFPFLKGKKKRVHCYTAIQSRNGLVTTKIGVSLHISLREKNKDRKKRNNSTTMLRIPFFFKVYIGIKLIYNVVLVSDVQQSESVIPIHIAILFLDYFPR